VVIEFPDTTG